MPTDIVMPTLSPSMEHGTLARWVKHEGDEIHLGDVIAEVETDKAMLEIEASHEGILSKILVPEGTPEVAVNTRIAIVTGIHERAVETNAASSSASPSPLAGEGRGEGANPTSNERSFAAVQNKTTPHPNPLPQGERGSEMELASDGTRRIFASPRAKRLASESGIDLSALHGSGPRGRIIEKDILQATANGATKLVTASIPQRQKIAAAAQGTIIKVPHDAMRKAIAQRLLEAKQTIPHFYLTVECEIDALLKLKDEINQAVPTQDGQRLYKISVNDFVIKAWALALHRMPETNVSWTDEALLKHQHVDVAVAVAIPGGLITPIIQQAELKSLSALSTEMKELAARAKSKKLKSEEYQGGTTSVSNLGMFGVKHFSAILNPPQATILAVGAGEKRIVVKNDQPAVVTLMSCTLSVDHRAIDGALAAQLLAAFKQIIEKPVSILL